MKNSNQTKNMSIVLIPGAWSDESVWTPLKEEIQKFGHSVHAITLSGIDNKKDVGKINLNRHIEDVVKFINDLNTEDVFLVGHSYSGFVATLTANEIPESISGLIFIEAFLPRDGKSLLEMAGLNVKEEVNSIKSHNGIWPPPTKEELESQPFLSNKNVEYLSNNLKGHPGQTVIDKAIIKKRLIQKIPTFFIGSNLSDDIESNPNFGKINFHKIEGGHWPMLTKPEDLAKIMDGILKNEIHP